MARASVVCSTQVLCTRHEMRQAFLSHASIPANELEAASPSKMMPAWLMLLNVLRKMPNRSTYVSGKAGALELIDDHSKRQQK